MGKGHSKLLAGSGEDSELDVSLLDPLPKESKDQILQKYEFMKGKIDDLHSQCEVLKVDSEQKYFELEQQLIVKSEKLEAESKSAAEYRQQVDDIALKYNDSSSNLRGLQEERFEKDNRLHEAERARSMLEAEKEALNNLLERKNNEIDRLNEEWTAMSLKVNEANKLRVESLAKVEELQTLETTVQHREQRIQQENNMLVQKNTWLDSELQSKINEILMLRKDQSSRMLEVQSQLDARNEEVTHLTTAVESLKAANGEQAEKMESYIQKLKEARDLHTEMEEKYRNEIRAQGRLLTLYKDGARESENKSKELVDAVAELQTLLKQATDAHDDLKTERTKDQVKFVAELKEKDETIEKLTKELESANELLEVAKKKGLAPLSEDDVESLSPSAAAASRLLKSGLTLTQIYNQYVQASEALHMEKEENSRLNLYLDEILQEITEKAPIMKKQREDYEKSLTTINQLTQQLDTAMLESEKLRVSTDESLRRYNMINRENQRLKHQTVDLGQQVRMLLKELSEARGTVVTNEPDLNISSTEVSSSSAIISERLVTFRSIEELQEQNQKLLDVVRELSENREQSDKENLDAKTHELKTQLDIARQELEEMQAARERQTELVEKIIKQRDMFRDMLNTQNTSMSMMSVPATPQTTSTPMQVHTQEPIRPLSSPEAERRAEQMKKELDKTRSDMEELQEDFKVYRREKGENEKLINEQCDKFRTESSEFRVQNAKFSSQLDFANERYKIAMSNTEGYKKEISALRDKIQKFSEAVIKHEATINTIRAECMALQSKLAHSEARCQNLQTERDILKNAEARLVQEKEALLREQSTQNLLTANLQTIQNNLERSEFEMKTQLTRQIDMYEKENTSLKKKLDTVDSQHRSVIGTLERQMNAAIKHKDEAVESHKMTTASLHSLRQELTTTQKQLMEMREKLAAAEERGPQTPISLPVPQVASPVGQTEKDNQIRNLKTEVAQLSAKARGLERQLADQKKHAEEYQAMANNFESKLSEEIKNKKKVKETSEKQLQDVQQRVVALEMEKVEYVKKKTEMERQMVELERNKQQVASQDVQKSDELNKMNMDLRKQLQRLQIQVKEAAERQEQAIKNEQLAREDCDRQCEIATEAQDKYQRELILHAADVEALTTVKQQLDGFSTKIIKAEDEAKVAQEKLAAIQSSQASTEKMYKDEATQLRKRLEDLQSHNDRLHTELETLGKKMTQMQQSVAAEARVSADLAAKVQDDDSGSSPDQLLEVIRFLRREKEIANTQLEMVEAETSRLKQLTSHLQKELEETNNSLSLERQQSQTSVHNAAQHADLMRKVENLNVLSDSNKLLREEHDRMQQKLLATEARANKLEEDIKPLQQNLNEASTQRDAVNAEKLALQAEMERWKARTNHLVEQCSKVDPEEMKRLMSERDSLRKKITQLTEDMNKLRNELTRTKNSHSTLQGQLNSSKQESAKLSMERGNLQKRIAQLTEESQKQKTEMTRIRGQQTTSQNELTASKEEAETLKQTIEQLKADIAVKDKDIEEKGKTTIQLRKIGRKYRLQWEGASKSLEEMKASMQESTQHQQVIDLQEQLKQAQEKLNESTAFLKEKEENMSAVNLTLKETSEKLSQTEESLKQKEEQVTQMGAVLKDAEAKLKAANDNNAIISENLGSAEYEKNAANKQVKELDASVKTLEAEVKKQSEELLRLQEVEKKLREEIDEAEKSKSQVNAVLQKARDKIKTQITEIDELKKKIHTMEKTAEESNLRLSSMKSQYEARVGKLEKDLREAAGQTPTSASASDVAQLQKLNAELTQKVAQLHKQLEQESSKPTVSGAPMERSSVGSLETRTANIRPMASPSTQARVQSAPVQPVRGTSTETTPRMASIRPLAVTPQTSGTPTATVMPTTVTQQDGEGSIASMGLPTSQVRPTQQVQPVSPRREEVHVEEVMSQPEQVSVMEREPMTMAAPAVMTTLPASLTVSVTPSQTQPPSISTLPASHSPPAAVAPAAQISVATSVVPVFSVTPATAVVTGAPIGQAMSVAPTTQATVTVAPAVNLPPASASVTPSATSATVAPTSTTVTVAPTAQAVTMAESAASSLGVSFSEVDTPTFAAPVTQVAAVTSLAPATSFVSTAPEPAAKLPGTMKRPREETDSEDTDKEPEPTKRSKTQEELQHDPTQSEAMAEEKSKEVALVGPSVVLPESREMRADAKVGAIVESEMPVSQSEKPVAPIEIAPLVTQTIAPVATLTPQPGTSQTGDPVIIIPDDSLPLSTVEDYEDSQEDGEGAEGEVEGDEYADDEDEEEEEDEDVDEEEVEEEEEEEEAEEMEQYEEEEEEGGDVELAESQESEEMEEEDHEEAMQEGDAADDDEDVVILDDDDEDDVEDAVMEAAPDVPTSSTVSDPAAGIVPVQANVIEDAGGHPPASVRIPQQAERLPAASRANLTPFIPLAQQPAFEEGDDSIVPSTPTLFVPRRSDGFAEAVSSPQVPHGRFIFGTGTDGANLSQPELAQLASQGALGMDDTRMDLSQLEEGRSLPTTPRSRTPPTISITEAPAESEAAQQSEGVTVSLGPSAMQQVEQQSEQSVERVSPDVFEDVGAVTATQAGESGDQSPHSPNQLSVPQPSVTSEPPPPTQSITVVGNPDLGDGDNSEKESQESSSQRQKETSAAEAAASTSQESSSKPRFQPIVWDDTPSQTSTAPQSSGGNPPGQSQQRKFTGGLQTRGRAQTARRGQPIQMIGGTGATHSSHPQQMPPQQRATRSRAARPSTRGRGQAQRQQTYYGDSPF